MTILPLKGYVTTVFSLNQHIQTPDLSVTGTWQKSRRKNSVFCKDCKE